MSLEHDDVKEQVRNATDIVDLIGRDLRLQRQGNRFVGKCPWHDDSRPSLQVNPDRQSWKCWVCDIGGDVFSFVMKREGMEFREALEMLAERAGIPLRRGKRAQPGSPTDKNALLAVLAWAEQQFFDYLTQSPDAEIARAYLRDRQITEENWQRFRLGFSPDSWDWLLSRARAASHSDQLLKATGLASYSESSRRTYDRFRGRVLFSIRDPLGRTVGFGGRVLPNASESQGAKYVNSPETQLFAKSQLLYALDTVREAATKKKHIIVVEGYTDAIMAYQAGVPNVVAVLGTALGQRHIRLLQRYVDRVTLVLDGDEAGQRRTNEILDLFLNSSLDLRIATLPSGMDPCDFLLKSGGDAFEALVERAPDALNRKIEVVTQNIDLHNDVQASHRAVEEILSALAGLQKAANVSQSQLKERQILSLLSRKFTIAEEDLRQRLRSIRQQPKDRFERRSSSDNAPQPAPRQPLDSWDRSLLEILVSQAEMVAEIMSEVTVVDLRSEPAKHLFDQYRRRHEAGLAVDFEHIMLSLEAPSQKSLLVELDEQAGHRAELQHRPAECLRQTLEAFRSRRLRGECRSELQRLEGAQLTEDEQLEALQKILEKRRSQQGL